MAEAGDTVSNTFLVLPSEIQGIENASNYTRRRAKGPEELSRKVESLNSINENATKAAITHEGRELCNLQDGADPLKEENNKNKKDFRLKMKQSKERARNSAQMSSSAKLQSGSSKKQEIESPSYDSPLEQLLRARKVSVDNRELLIAAGEGDLGKAENLIQEGSVDINFADRDGNTALHYAVERSNLEIINLLIESNAKIDVENAHHETSFDVAVRWNNEEIIEEFEKEVVKRCIVMLKDTKKVTICTSSQKSKEVEEEIKSTEVEMIENTEVEKTKKKINTLLELLKQNEKKSDNLCELDCEKAMIFILFLETFAFQGSRNQGIRNNLRGEFLKSTKKNFLIEEYRSLFLKSVGKFYKFSDIKNVIEIDTFFNNLKKQLSRYMERKEKIDIGVLLLERPPNKNSIGSVSDSDPYSKLIDLVIEASKKDVDLHKQWFEFNLNIYPNLKDEKGCSDLRKEIDHVRNDLIHSFYDYGIYEFREAVIDLRGKLLEYSYAKQVYKDILNSLVVKDPAKIEKELEDQLQKVKKKFKETEELSSEEANQLFGYRVEKCLYSPLAKEVSQQKEFLKGLIIDYWKYLLPLDLVSAQRFSNKLSGVSRRELFEKFIKLKRTKHIIPDNYDQGKQVLKKEVENYGFRSSSFNQICKNYVEDDQKLDKKANEVVDKIVKFISITQSAKEILGYGEDNIITFARDILEMQDEHVKKLVLTQIQSINRMKIEFERQLSEDNQDIRQLMDLQNDLSKVFIEEKAGIIQLVDKRKKLIKGKKRMKVTETVINVVEMLYNAYNEYKVDFNLKEIFATRSFLNVLIEEIKDNIPIIIDRLIDIDYMSPLVSSLIVRESEKVTINITLEKLIDHMLDAKRYADYLNDLLKVECYNEFKFHEKFYLKVCEKDIDIHSISLIFKEPTNSKEFIDLLVDKFNKSRDDRQEKNRIIKLVKGLLEIINKEISERYCYKNIINNPSNLLEAAKEIYKLKNEIGKVCPDFTGFADMSILKAKIKNKEEKFQKALTILKKLEKELENNVFLKASYLLTLSEIACTYKLQNKYVESQSKYTVLYHKIISYSLELDTKAKKVVPTLYEKVKDLNEYKNLLHSSELLHSEKCLNVLNVLADIAHMATKLSGRNICGDNLKEALEIYQAVYRFRKTELDSDPKKDIHVLECIASTNMKLGNQYKNEKRYSDALSYLQNALIKYILVYDCRKEMLSDNDNLVIQTVRNIRKKVLDTLGNIALTHINIAELKSSINPEEALKHYENAFIIYKEALEVQIRIRSKKHYASTHITLAKLKASVNPEEALGHYKKAFKIYDEVVDAQISILSKTNNNTNTNKPKAIKNLELTKLCIKLCNKTFITSTEITLIIPSFTEDALKLYENATKIYEQFEVK